MQFSHVQLFDPVAGLGQSNDSTRFTSTVPTKEALDFMLHRRAMSSHPRNGAMLLAKYCRPWAAMSCLAFISFHVNLQEVAGGGSVPVD